MARTKFKVKEGLAVSDDASSAGYDLLPPGTVMAYAGSTAPTGWLLCNGQAVSRSTYANLFAAVSTTYGNGDGSSTFNLPDTKGRTVVGVGSGADLTARSLNDRGGAETVTLTAAQSGLVGHGHGNSFGVSMENADTDHRHSADHDHPNTSSGTATGGPNGDGQHYHSPGSNNHTHTYLVGSLASAGTNRAIISASGTSSGNVGAIEFTNPGAITGDSGSNHYHNTDLGNQGVTTGWQSATHKHTLTFTGSVTSQTSASAAEAHTNMPPFIALNYIIKY